MHLRRRQLPWSSLPATIQLIAKKPPTSLPGALQKLTPLLVQSRAKNNRFDASISRRRVLPPLLLLQPQPNMESDPEIETGYVAGTHLTPRKRKFLTGMRAGGATAREISSQTKIPLQTIRDTLALDSIRDNGHSQCSESRHRI